MIKIFTRPDPLAGFPLPPEPTTDSGPVFDEPSQARRRTFPAPNGAPFPSPRGISSRRTPPVDDFSSNRLTTGLLQLGLPVTGNIDRTGDRDWFKTTLEAGTTYRFSLEGITLDERPELADPVLTLRDSRGRLIAQNDDITSGNFNSEIIFTPQFDGTYYLEAKGFRTQIGTYQILSQELSAAPDPVSNSDFDIDIAYTGDAQFRPFFEAAAQRWSEIITSDLPNFGGVDDLLITVTIDSIDGNGGILGFAGFDLLRPSDLGGLPYKGSTTLDLSDVQRLRDQGTLGDVVLHEFGHILGIGTLWRQRGLRNDNTFEYTGANAVREYNNLGGAGDSVPLESGGGSGTRLSHWSEGVFRDELMTGFLSGRTNPLSRLTVGSLQDLGYTVNYSAADSYSLRSFSSSPDPFTASGSPEPFPTLIDSSVFDDNQLIGALGECFCGTCAALSLQDFDVSKFSSSFSNLSNSDAQGAQGSRDASLLTAGQIYTPDSEVFSLPSFYSTEDTYSQPFVPPSDVYAAGTQIAI